MKRTTKQVKLMGFNQVNNSSEYINQNMIVGIKDTNRKNEFMCIFHYYDMQKGCQILHYANKIDGFQPALTRPKSKAIQDLKEYFNI